MNFGILIKYVMSTQKTHESENVENGNLQNT
jgi:hypothetical protein